MRMNSITKLFIAATVVLAAAAGNIFAQGSRTKTVPGLTGSWQSYEICDNSVSAVFPALPTEQVRSTEITGSNMTTKVNTSSSGSSVYMVNCFDGLPFSAESMSAVEKKAFFTRMMQNYTQLMSVMMKTNGMAGRVRLLPVRETIYGGLAGLEQSFSIGTSQGKAKIALYGNRGVWSLIMTVGGAPPVKTSADFFSSMEVKQPELAEK